MKFIALVFSCLVVLGMHANASEAGTLEMMVTLANKGNAEAQYHVGMMHHNGIGTPRNPTQAFEWFQKSAAAGDPLAAYKLGCYYDGQGAGVVAPNIVEALKYKQVAADAGYALAQNDVAILYAKDGKAAEAIKWWKMASAQGHHLALYNLSAVYAAGQLIPRDPSFAYAYLKLSKRASQNDLDKMVVTLSKPELLKAEKLVSEWSPEPTTLTLKAMSGVRAADELLKVAGK